ncbi:MAG TPA: HAD-IA family hydrolase [Patescibacteria group bacterium]|nr:HAD-IA family hydrolase [Patescibacteria group bacterium]
MIKAIVFDCYGVLVGRGFRETYREAGGDPNKDDPFIHQVLGLANLALISPTDFNKRVADRIGVSVDDWLETAKRMEQPNTKLFTYVRTELKERYKIGMVSNANQGSVQRRLPPDALALFDAIVVSGEVGCVKPERKIFEIAAERLGVELKDMLFIDDQTEYVEAARGYGITAIQYYDFFDFTKQIETVLYPQT